jgi:hypothetical protein
MKKLLRFVILALLLWLCPASRAALTITNNLNLTPADTSYEGADIIVSNCTVTLDGTHSFNSLLIGAGGVLTHTAAPNGSATRAVTVTNEQLVLTGANPSTLFYSFVTGSVSLTDTNQNIFTSGIDFIQTTVGNQMQITRTANSTIPDGATVLATYTWSVTFSTGLNFYVTNILNVATGGSINANGGGYGGNNGSGRGNSILYSARFLKAPAAVTAATAA